MARAIAGIYLLSILAATYAEVIEERVLGCMLEERNASTSSSSLESATKHRLLVPLVLLDQGRHRQRSGSQPTIKSESE
ncbi:hypothetical protein KQX54_005639 [Cotesia glomerata]|uniref:Secreted protein n=1 Tax=Cotesia glomerata TaxID=32391 RepID=A0AAV7HI23_COTGL|nr:hypothetical protein KQX54_005639 [Cotesia glomerata]